MIPRPLLPVAFLALATCGDPFSPQSDSGGPPTGAIRVDVEVPGNPTFDEDGFSVSSPYFKLEYPPLGGAAYSPALPGGLPVRLRFEGLAEWCHPNPVTRLDSITPGDTQQVTFVVNCETLIRPVYFLAKAVPDTLPPFQVRLQVGLTPLVVANLTTGVPYLDSLPVNSWPVIITPPAGCHRDPNEDNVIRVPAFSADTLRYIITVICGS